MTIQDSYIRVVEFLRQHDSFSMEENLKEVASEEGEQSWSAEAFELALGRLEKAEIVARANGKNTWILLRPLDALPQNVVVSGETAATVARIVNRACELMDDKASGADPLNINESDILKLCSILQDAVQTLQAQMGSEVAQPQHIPLGFAA